jgi:hypothetical protein
LIAATMPTTQPVPSEAAQAKAEKLIREIYLTDYRQTEPSKRQTLAARLLQQGREAQSDGATRFVLLRESRDIAASVGDAVGAVDAIEMLHCDFGVDPTPMSITALTTSLGVARSPQSLTAIIQVSLTAADHAISEDDYAGVSRLTALAAAAAARVRDEELTQQVRDHTQEVQRMAEQYDRVKAARDLLRTSGRNAECNLIVGRYLCFIKGDFANGLPLLVAGSDAALREAASAELAPPTSDSGMLKLANQWWDIAETQSGLAKANLRQHAGAYFRQAIGGDTPYGRKPNPAGLLHLAADCDIDPGRVLLVGDSPIDLATARNAGASICLARYGFGYRFEADDFRGDELFIDAPADLVGLIAPGAS